MAAKRQRGERAGITRAQVLDKALELVDRVGLGGLTMRALGAELGVEAMTLYHYVPNKDALIDGLVERVFTAATPAAAGDDWREHLRAYAHELRMLLLEHPGVLPVIVRPAATPATLDAVETGLQVLTGAGFRLGTALDAINTLTLFVISHTAAEVAIGETAPPTLDAERHPLLLAAATTNAGGDDFTRFAFAVEALLTGFDEAR
ncbi:TetR/AcrR family transcriptional regulator C-terminal domain-containing protein [Dactylosporangium vinaceum]|uniref:TetR/AcrR family transcriptional regulator C-terminal domain-containing protein n=1 Tax=Dactylosporangium vinaceum TaxID=53362 RepID=A0ABV5M4D7_9ACTN|nr:TetR/AcrR family transcriptional regulator C-terminal domain-containing protein [Dactylosporangium vinaceum]